MKTLRKKRAAVAVGDLEEVARELASNLGALSLATGAAAGKDTAASMATAVDAATRVLAKDRPAEVRHLAKVLKALSDSTRQEALRFLQTHPSVAEVVSEPTSGEAGELFQAEQLNRARAEKIIDSLLPRTAVPSAVAVLQARRNAEAREMLLQEFGALTSSEVSKLASSEARNRAALANRWKQEGRILSVTRHGTTLFPGFQFDDQGRPKVVVAKVIRTLGPASSDWELALWFTKATGWLGGRRPVDLLDQEPEAVVKAAECEAAGLVF